MQRFRQIARYTIVFVAFATVLVAVLLPHSNRFWRRCDGAVLVNGEPRRDIGLFLSPRGEVLVEGFRVRYVIELPTGPIWMPSGGQFVRLPFGYYQRSDVGFRGVIIHPLDVKTEHDPRLEMQSGGFSFVDIDGARVEIKLIDPLYQPPPPEAVRR